jgi:hypothetical protein
VTPQPPPLPPARPARAEVEHASAAAAAPGPKSGRKTQQEHEDADEDEDEGEGENENEEKEEKVEEEPGPVLFARCNRSTDASRHRDRDEAPPEGPAQVGQGARLRPPLAGTAALSADSGTGDTGSLEVQVDGLGGPSQHQLPPAESAEGEGGGDGDGDRDRDGDGDGGPEAEVDEVADDELADDAEEPRHMSQRLTAGDAITPESKPVGAKGTKHQVKPFTKASLDRLESRHVQLVRDYGFQPKRKTSVEDGGVLPNKFEPFPSNLYGRPLEEIDNFIYDEVSLHQCFIPLRHPFIPSTRLHLSNSIHFITKHYESTANPLQCLSFQLDMANGQSLIFSQVR